MTFFKMLRNYFSKLINLLQSIKNPPFFMYRMSHYLKHSVPIKMAKKIAACNIQEYKNNPIGDVIVHTYDGSCQVVHPDITLWRSNYWLIVTPYPYGMEEYENPCVYKIKNLTEVIENATAPIAYPKTHNYGVHLSDPCIFNDGINMGCVYRNTWKENGFIYNAIFYAEYRDSKWGKHRMLFSSMQDPLLSPAVIIGNDNYYYIYTALDTNYLQQRVVDLSCRLCKTIQIPCLNLPKDHTVWHISVVYDNNLEKKSSTSTHLVGLFLLKDLKNHDFKLYKAFATSLNSVWLIQEKINLPKCVQRHVKIVYKSCFVPGSHKILISFRDKNDRYRLCVIQAKETMRNA